MASTLNILHRFHIDGQSALSVDDLREMLAFYRAMRDGLCIIERVEPGYRFACRDVSEKCVELEEILKSRGVTEE